MGQYAVILVISALFLGGILLFNARASTGAAGEETTAYAGDRFAREAAQYGLEQTERKLAADVTNWALWDTDPNVVRNQYGSSGTHGESDYTVTISDMEIAPPYSGSGPVTDSDKVWVTATSSFNVWNPSSASHEDTHYIVEAVYEKGWTDVGTPPEWRRAVVANNLCLQGSTRIAGDIHANGELCGNPSNAYIVEGQGTYSGSLSPRTNVGNFEGGVAEGDPIPVPPVVIPPLAERDCTVTGSPYALNGELNITISDGWLCGVTGQGTASNPFVLVVEGNLEINGAVHLKGHVNIYATGNVTLQSNPILTPLDASVSMPNGNSDMEVIQAWAYQHLTDSNGEFIGSTLGIFAQGNIHLQGTPKVIAHLYTNGSVSYGGSGNGFLIGGILARGNLALNGSPPIFYTEANETLFPGANVMVPEGVRLIAYREWAERPDHPTP